MPMTRWRITVMTSGAGVLSDDGHILSNSRCLVVKVCKDKDKSRLGRT
jgi:hypothetical protein